MQGAESLYTHTSPARAGTTQTTMQQQWRFRIHMHNWESRYIAELAALGSFLATLIACARPISPSPTPGVVHKPATEKIAQDSVSSSSPTGLIYLPGQIRYSIQVSSAIQVVAGDSVQRIDSTQIRGNLQVVFTKAPTRDQVVAEVQNDSMLFTVGAGTSIATASGPLSAFEIDLRTGRITPNESQRTMLCDPDRHQRSIFSGREVLPSMQPRIVSTWVDTSATTVCRDSVVLVLTRVASYTRLQISDTAQQLIVRLTRVTVSGRGHQWGQKVDVSGNGTATDTLRLDGSPLRLQESTGNSHLRLQFRAPLKVQEFTQDTQTHIRLQR